MKLNPDSAAQSNESQTQEIGAGKKEIGLYKFQHLEKMRDFSQSSKAHLTSKISVLAEVFIRMERESRTKRPGGVAADIQAVSFLACPNM